MSTYDSLAEVFNTRAEEIRQEKQQALAFSKCLLELFEKEHGFPSGAVQPVPYGSGVDEAKDIILQEALNRLEEGNIGISLRFQVRATTLPTFARVRLDYEFNLSNDVVTVELQGSEDGAKSFARLPEERQKAAQRVAVSSMSELCRMLQTIGRRTDERQVKGFAIGPESK